MPVPSVPTLQPKAPIMPKNIVINRHSDINISFPKMGIWVVASLVDVDVCTIDGINIITASGKSYPILTVKEKWDYNFNPPYVFTGPFGTVDSAADWAKSNPNQAVVEKSKQTQAVAKKAPVGAPASAGPVKNENTAGPVKNEKTASQIKKDAEDAIKNKLPKIQEEQKKIINKFDDLIASKAGNPVKSKVYSLMKDSFVQSVNAMNQNILAWTSAIDAYVLVNPDQPISPQINGKSLVDVLAGCIECNSSAQMFVSKMIELG